MIEIDASQINYYLSLYFWPFVRILALIASAPFFSERQINNRTKIGLALVITFIVAPTIPYTYVPLISVAGLWTLIKQILIGLMVGFILQMAFGAIRIAGEIIGLQMGLSFAVFFDPSGGPNMPVLARILNVFAMLMFLTFQGHLWLLSILIDSFTILPISDEPLSRMGFLALLETASTMFIYGLMFAIPLVCILLLLNIMMGILNRMTPQLSVFVIGFPISLFMGIYLLSIAMPRLNGFLEGLFEKFFIHIQLMLDALVYT